MFEIREWNGKLYIVLVYGDYSLGAIQLAHIYEPETTYWHFVNSDRYTTDNPLQATGSPHKVQVPPGLTKEEQLVWKAEQFKIAECPLEWSYRAHFEESLEQAARRRIALEVFSEF